MHHLKKLKTNYFCFKEIELPLSNILAQLEYEANLVQQKQIIEAQPIEKNTDEKIETQQEKISKTNQGQEQKQETHINQLKSFKDVFGYQK
ncbi:hypothetical protein ACEW7V_00630 [Areca yellow leaf disease phytoplasma]|uniref:hypothetical protein n=1 Tax=Areca yellow leaf disease phytoplasma TaxID=927614 RepID=UPI0035B535A4